MTIHVDTWGGDLHQRLGECRKFDNWEEAASWVGEMLEAGLLCNVLHADFIMPQEKTVEANAALAREYLNEAEGEKDA
jgi:hypothetical protein